MIPVTEFESVAAGAHVTFSPARATEVVLSVTAALIFSYFSSLSLSSEKYLLYYSVNAVYLAAYN